MKCRGCWILAGVCAALWLPGYAAQGWDKEKPKKEPPALPATLAGFSDSGNFGLYKEEERLATISFSWKPDGSFENNSTLSIGGQSVKQSLKITPDKDGRWLSIVATSPASSVTVVRNGGVVTQTNKKKSQTVNLKLGALLFDNFSPALMSQAVRGYEKVKGGKQSFPLFIIPGVMVNLTLEPKEPAERSVAGRDWKFKRYTYTLASLDVNLWTDNDGKLYLADVPAQHAAYVREGFEILRKREDPDPLLSQADHQVKVDRGVGVPMRDGVKLSTDIFRPQGTGKYPVILIRTPYKKEMTELKGFYFARRGYVVAIQDCRGRFGSPGNWEPFMSEGDDGYDAVEWLSARPWSSGKVGMIGGSYLGWVQWWAASRQPPHLVTIIPNVAPPDPFYNLPYEYGVFFLWGAIWWADILESAATGDLSGAAMEKIGEKKYHTLLRSLPVIELDKKVLGKENPYWRHWIDHPVNDSFWEPANFLDRLGGVHIPVFHQSGWFDGDGIGSKLNYQRMAANHHPNQKLILGPWGHTDEAMRGHGGRDFGEKAIIDLPRAYLRWFDFWLKGIDNGITKEPLVSIFVMGSNRWLTGNTYPLPETKFEKWYLASGGKANTSAGDGSLTRAIPPPETPADKFTYDPGDPTPDPKFYEEPEQKEGDKKPRSSEELKKLREGFHESITKARKDILVYVSEPFKTPYTFAGPLTATLYAASSARDTDWFMRLMEVDEKGKLFPLVEGKIRARYRESTKKPVFLEAGKVYEYTLDLWQTGITIPAGRRLRVEVASASFPFFSRNLNTGGHNEKDSQFVPADQTIYHNKDYPSHILLPAILEVEKKKQ